MPLWIPIDVAALAREPARTTRAPNASDRFAERSERLSELGTKEFGFFPGGEVTALVDLVEVYQVAIGAPGPCLRGLIILVRKNRDGHRERDFVGLLRGRNNNGSSAVLPVQPRCRRRAVRQPVQRDVVQHVVFGEQALGLAVVIVID